LQESPPGCWSAVTKIGDFSAYRTFTGAKVGLGRCDVCWAGKAVYRSREAQAKGWEEQLSVGQEFEKTAGLRGTTSPKGKEFEHR